MLFSLLDRISQLGRDNYNEKVLNVLHRWDCFDCPLQYPNVKVTMSPSKF